MLMACQSGADIGTGCSRDSECASPLVCRLTRCRNACTTNRDCPVGSDCLLDENRLGSCSIPGDRGCASGGTACPTPLTCANDRCVNACTGNGDCPSDGECRAVPEIGLSFCVAPQHDDAGVAVDAGANDAAIDAPSPPSDASVAPCTGPECAGRLAVGGNFACVVHSDGVWCWGDNRQGQLGDGTNAQTPATHRTCGAADTGFGDCSLSPVQVRDEHGQPLLAEAVACSEQAACAITPRGTIACWGGNIDDWQDGMAGNPSAVAVELSLETTGRFEQIVAGRAHFCATTGNGGGDSVWCWGSNAHGQFGNGDMASPTASMAGGAWNQQILTAGTDVTCGLVGGTGVVSCAGTNVHGQIDPTGSLITDVTMPLALGAYGSDAGIVTFAVGDGFGCALLANDTVSCLGWGVAGSLGHAGDDDEAPLAIAGHAFGTLWSGGYTSFACARQTTGEVYCWGQLERGQCLFLPAGDPGLHCTTPVRAQPFDGALAIAMGGENICAIFAGGAVQCAGYGDYGQLGTGSVVARPDYAITPVSVCFGGGC